MSIFIDLSLLDKEKIELQQILYQKENILKRITDEIDSNLNRIKKSIYLDKSLSVFIRDSI